MKLFKLLNAFLVGISFLYLQSCTSSKYSENTPSVYYVAETSSTTIIYDQEPATSAHIKYIPAGKRLLIKRQHKKYYIIVYDNEEYFVTKSALINYRSYDANLDNDLYLRDASQNAGNSYSSNSSSGAGSYTPSRSSKSTGGTVQVKGYYRSNGTYVAPYTRRAPTRRH